MKNRFTHYHKGPKTIKSQQPITKLDFVKTKIVLKLLVLVAFIVFLSMFYIWSRIQIVQIGYQINDLVLEQQQLVSENKNYRTELLYLKAPQRLESIAATKLNMTPPKQDSIIEIKEKPAEDKGNK